MQEYTYSSNNSGGSWWLSDDDWKALEKAGWRVWWGGHDDTYKNRKYETAEEAENDRWLGALAREARGLFNSHEEAVESFERATGERYEDEGCECCGSPHSIY